MEAVVQDNTASKLIEVASEAMEAFGNDIYTMFGVEVVAVQKERGEARVDALKRLFKKVCAVHTVQADGTLQGTLYLIFDQAGLFTMAGVVVMLPEARIHEEAKRGTDVEAKAMADAIGEVGNLLVGAWDRIFRTGWTGHKHFAKGATFIGQPWDNAQEAIGLTDGQGLEMALYEMTVGSYPPFSFAVLFSKDLWEPKPQPIEEEPAEASAAQPAQAATEPSPASQPGEQAAAPQPEGSKEGPAVTEQAESTPSAQTPDPTLPSVTQAEASQPEPAPPAGGGLEGPSGAAFTDRQAVGLLNAPVDAVMTREMVWVSPDDSVLDVLRAMQNHDVGYAMVGRPEALEGIVSKSNVLGAISPYLRPVFAKWRRPEDDATLNIKIKWVMSRPVQTIHTSTTLGLAIERMQQFGGRCLPVTAPNGKVVGMLTVFDILRALAPNKAAGRTPQAPCLMA